jgi:hypothetical protein
MSIGRISGPRTDALEVAHTQVDATPTAPLDAPRIARGAPVHAAPDASADKLLTKKIAGERVLMHHLAGRIGPKYEAKVVPGADREHYVVKLHRRQPTPPFDPETNPEAVYNVDRRSGKLERIDGEAAPVAPTRPTQHGGVQAFGELARPGRALKGTTQTLRPGESITFRTRENQIIGIGEIRVERKGAIEVRRKLLDPSPAGRLGGASLYEYTFAAPRDARPGTEARISTIGHFQSRNDADWAFSFAVHVK